MSEGDAKLAKQNALEELRKIKEEILQRERNSNNNPPNKPVSKLKHSGDKYKSKKHKEKRSHKKHKKSEKEKHKPESSSAILEKESSSSSEEDLSPPKKRSCSPELTRDDWMTSSVLLKTFSKNKHSPKKQCTSYEAYEPGNSSRELNPHWRNGGTGLPAFKKPKEDSDDDDHDNSAKYSSYKYAKRGWVKKTETVANTTITTESKSQDEEKPSSSSSISRSDRSAELLTDQQMNELGAKILKAEILNNKELADELRNKLNLARIAREHKGKKGDEVKNSNQRTSSHTERATQRLARKFPIDDQNDLKNKFERETNKTADSTKSTKDPKRFKEDFDDVFGLQKSERDADQGTSQSQSRQTKKLNNCDKCLHPDKKGKELVVSVGKHVYLALPWHEGLQPNHCMIIPIDHYTCSTDLDEDVWQEISTFRRVLTKVFAERKEDVLFFETALYPNKRPHMVIHCVPSKNFEMAPFYFKKAIEESEFEWSKNKKLVTLKEKNLRKSIPNGLPYFWVNFAMDFGFAHVIEHQDMFSTSFAQEIIAGMLMLDMDRWRTPRKESNVKTKVKNLINLLKPYESEIS